MRALASTLRFGLLAAVASSSCAAIVGIEDKEPFPIPAVTPDAEAVDARGDEAATTSEEVVAEVAGAWGVAVDDSYVYVTSETEGKVYRRARGGGPLETIATGQAEPHEIYVDGTRIYWHSANTLGRTEIDGGAEVPTLLSIPKVALDGGVAPTVIEDHRTPSPAHTFAFAPEDDDFFVVSLPTEVVRFRRAQFGPQGTIANNGGGVTRAPTAVAADKAYFYWFQQNTFDLWRRPKSSVGGDPPAPERFAIVPGEPDIWTMVADQEALYFVTGGGLAAKVSTTGIPDAGDASLPTTELAAGFPSPQQLAHDRENVYATRGEAAGEVVLFAKAGGAGVVLAKQQDRPRGIAVRSDGQKRWVYWATYGDGRVRRAPVP